METFFGAIQPGENRPVERLYAKSFHPKDEVSLMETLLGQSSWGTIHPVEAVFVL